MQVKREDNVFDKGVIVLQKLFAEIKDEDKEHIFTEKVDANEEDDVMPSHRHEHDDAISFREKEDFSMSLKNENVILSATCNRVYHMSSKCIGSFHLHFRRNILNETL